MVNKKTHGLKKPQSQPMLALQYTNTKEVISNQKQPSCKKRCSPQKGHGEKRCEIQGGGQEMAVMVG